MWKLIFFIIVCQWRTFIAVETPLDIYVKRADPNFNFVEIRRYDLSDHTIHILNFTSQKWLNESYVKPTIWWHFMSVCVPKNLSRPDAAILFIDGHGNDPNDVPKPTDTTISLLTIFSITTGSVSVVIRQVPNEPTLFYDDPSKKIRKEDGIIAWTWKEYLEKHDPWVLLRLPMTKAVSRSFTAVQLFMKSEHGVEVEKFMVAGGSKRGWATWTVAAVDDRVFAFAPIVLDILNIRKAMRHMWRSLGGWTFAFKDYYELNVTKLLDSPNFKDMEDIIDPLAYNERYINKPKLVICSSGDEFFLPDNEINYWQQLSGVKYLKRNPNAEHSCAGHYVSIFSDLRAFFLANYEKHELPEFNWQRNYNGTHGIIIVTTNQTPLDIVVYKAHTLSNSRRDFRLLIADPNDPKKIIPNPVIWFKEHTVQKISENQYIATYPIPEIGWLGFFVEATFTAFDTISDFAITTETVIIPDEYPFPNCSGVECYGTLV
ncbi:hypothetical protein SNEBB_009555 [Seison nebaliae]|nr:hypothetical protein SNEBB_009555 [Seison nebaliae]